jgi:tetratricopeptide (TPR) repeat protein
MGVINRKEGDYNAAEELHRKALEILKASVGSDHPHVATVMLDLGLLHTIRKDYILAEESYRRALDIRDRKLAANHPKIAEVLDAYAELLRSLDRTSEAAELELRSEAIRSFENNAE